LLALVLSLGAISLGLDQSTVSRRLHAFEERIGQELFVGTAKRNALSPIGQKYLEGALRLERVIEETDQDISAHDKQSGGTVHVVTADILANHLLLSVTSKFLKKFPDINLRIRIQPSGEEPLLGDVALFTTNSPKVELYGRKLATASFASYASQPYYEQHKTKLDTMVWLNWDDGTDSPTWRALAPYIPDHLCRLRIDTVASLLEAVRLGVGATILPCFIGESDPALVRIAPGETISSRDIWLLVRSDLRNVPRIRIFLDFFAQHIKSHKHLIESA
jgi:DNA-binding transcriptional LysR family regulator